jgi:hypothetical protein
MAMPWSRAKAKAQAYRDHPETQKRLTALFDACFRIQREASEAAGRHIPMIVENVRGAQPWVGRSVWNYGSFHLWGDVPALMPSGNHQKAEHRGSWFYGNKLGSRSTSSGSKKRKRWSAMIAKIPEPLARHIARVFKP